MLRFLRQIRQRLLSDNKFSKYVLYAVGEILLVVIGILIAIQVDNWNESNRTDFLFKDSMEQILNSLESDVAELERISNGLNNQVKLIDIVLERPETFNLMERPFALHYIMWDYHGVKINTGTEYYIQNLIYNPESKQQKNLAKDLTDYLRRISGFQSDIDIDFNEILYQHGLPRALIPVYDGQELFIPDSSFYTKDQMNTATVLMHSDDIKNTLKTIKTKSQYDLGSLADFIKTSETLRLRINTYIGN
jgi:hypothetical protein